jgi:flagellar biosynthesis protein FlhA
VLQGLLAERVSIRDLPRVLEAIAEALAVTQSTALITEHVRARLARQIASACTAEGGFVPILALSPGWEQAFADAIVGQGDDRQLAMAPSELQRFVRALQDTLEAHAMRGELPVLLTSPGIRPFVRAVVERVRPATVVLSQNEVHPKARIRTLGQL